MTANAIAYGGLVLFFLVVIVFAISAEGFLALRDWWRGRGGGES